MNEWMNEIIIYLYSNINNNNNNDTIINILLSFGFYHYLAIWFVFMFFAFGFLWMRFFFHSIVYSEPTTGTIEYNDINGYLRANYLQLIRNKTWNIRWYQ